MCIDVDYMFSKAKCKSNSKGNSWFMNVYKEYVGLKIVPHYAVLIRAEEAL
jgi:hypothetical protein